MVIIHTRTCTSALTCGAHVQQRGIRSMFGSVVAVPFQITFHVEMHANDFFIFLKMIVDISTSKRSKTYKTY